jgi:transcriptional regulator with XRE-family HTH domain
MHTKGMLRNGALRVGYLLEGIMVKLQQTFIKNLRQEREAAKLTQEKLAEKTGISHKYLNAIELGYKFPSIQTIENLAKALEIAPFRLFVSTEQEQRIPPADLLGKYNRFLGERQKDELSKARKEFLDRLG